MSLSLVLPAAGTADRPPAKTEAAVKNFFRSLPAETLTETGPVKAAGEVMTLAVLSLAPLLACSILRFGF